VWCSCCSAAIAAAAARCCYCCCCCEMIRYSRGKNKDTLSTFLICLSPHSPDSFSNLSVWCMCLGQWFVCVCIGVAGLFCASYLCRIFVWRTTTWFANGIDDPGATTRTVIEVVTCHGRGQSRKHHPDTNCVSHQQEAPLQGIPTRTVSFTAIV
jgi:hypothetical protein